MGKWFNQLEAIVWVAMLSLGAITFIYSAFATKEFVNIKHDGVMEVLREIREDVKELRRNQGRELNGKSNNR